MHQLIDVVMEGAKRPDPIKIRKQVTVVMVLTFGWREMGATNKERLLIDIAKTAAFGVNVRHDIKATITLANITAASQFASRGDEVRKAK